MNKINNEVIAMIRRNELLGVSMLPVLIAAPIIKCELEVSMVMERMKK